MRYKPRKGQKRARFTRSPKGLFLPTYLHFASILEWLRAGANRRKAFVFDEKLCVPRVCLVQSMRVQGRVEGWWRGRGGLANLRRWGVRGNSPSDLQLISFPPSVYKVLTPAVWNCVHHSIILASWESKTKLRHREMANFHQWTDSHECVFCLFCALCARFGRGMILNSAAISET